MDFDGAIASFSKSMKAQLDLAEEARNLKVFAQNFKDFDRIVFAVPYEEFTNQSVLVESFETGVQISEYINNDVRKKEGINYQLARLGFISFLKMLLIDNFVHGGTKSPHILHLSISPSHILCEKKIFTQEIFWCEREVTVPKLFFSTLGLSRISLKETEQILSISSQPLCQEIV